MTAFVDRDVDLDEFWRYQRRWAGSGSASSGIMIMMNQRRVDNRTKNELSDSLRQAAQAVREFRNSSLFTSADAVYSKLRSILRHPGGPAPTNRTEELIDKEAGTILTLAKEFAEEAQAFVVKNGDIEVDRTDKENYYSPWVRMYFLHLKWYALWEAAASDLRLNRLHVFGPFSFALEVKDQAKDDMLDAIETIKNNVDDVLDAAMDRVGYTAYKMIYNTSRCLHRPKCSNGELQELTKLLQDFAKKVKDAIDY